MKSRKPIVSQVHRAAAAQHGVLGGTMTRAFATEVLAGLHDDHSDVRAALMFAADLIMPRQSLLARLRGWLRR